MSAEAHVVGHAQSWSGLSTADPSDDQPRVVVAHDYLTQRGGAERVVLALLRAFPGSPLITSLYAPEATFPEFAEHRVETLWPNHVPALRRDARRALPVLAGAFARRVVRDADAVVCSSSGWAHGLGALVPKVVYCYNPPRWLHQAAEYAADLPMARRAALAAVSPALRRWDARSAASAARYVTTSTTVAARIRSAYGIEASLVPPPVTLDIGGQQTPVAGVQPGYLLTIARGRGYKNVDVVRSALADLPGERLVVVGSNRRGSSDAVVRELGMVSESELRWLYAHAKAVVSVAHEDFGLTPLEGNAYGTPAVLLRAGGFLDTLVHGVTGVYAEAATPEAVRAAIRALPLDLDPARIRAHAAGYSEAVFVARMRRIVDEVVKEQKGARPLRDR